MPPPPPQLAPLPAILLLLASSAVLAGMLLAWYWALGKLLRGEPLLPPRAPRRVPWGVSAILATIVLYFLVSNLVGLSFLVAGGQTALDSPRAKLSAMAAINGLLLLLLPRTLRILSGARAADLGVEHVHRADLRMGVVGCLLAAVPTYLLFAVASRIWKPQGHPMERMIGEGGGPGMVALAILSGVILAPIAEELVFRGVLLGWLERVFRRAAPNAREGDGPSASLVPEVELAGGVLVEDVGREENPWSAPQVIALESLKRGHPGAGLIGSWGPNILTSILFAALHASQWPAPVPLFALSLALGWLARRSGGLVAPMAMHATFNGLSTGMLLLATWAGATAPPAPETGPAPEMVQKLVKPPLGKNAGVR